MVWAQVSPWHVGSHRRKREWEWEEEQGMAFLKTVHDRDIISMPSNCKPVKVPGV
jgi:hypothetical protein